MFTSVKTSLITAAILLFGTSARAETFSTILFEKGAHGYHTFRIPAIVEAGDGTLLAFAEARRNSKSDTGDIDLVLRRSTDGGRTWGGMTVVWDDGENVCGNPAPVVDRQTGRILLLATRNLGTDHEKEINEGRSTDTRRVYLLTSDDHGATWSRAREITVQTKKAEWTWYATGPCHGIQLTRGAHKGRLVVSCDHHDGTHYNSHLIYSDDGGETWRIGGIGAGGNESSVAELGNGDLMLCMRGERNKERFLKSESRLIARSSDGGETLGASRYHEQLIEPVCQGTLVNYAPGNRKASNTLLFANPADKTRRINMTVKTSHDNGRTWNDGYRISKSHSAYSDLVVLRTGDVGLLWENGDEGPYERITFTSIPYRFLK